MTYLTFWKFLKPNLKKFLYPINTQVNPTSLNMCMNVCFASILHLFQLPTVTARGY